METREELLKDFLSNPTDAGHPCDRERFLKYAIACAKEDATINSVAMLNSGISNDDVDRYEEAYGWIRDAYNFMMRNNNVNDNE